MPLHNSHPDPFTDLVETGHFDEAEDHLRQGKPWDKQARIGPRNQTALMKCVMHAGPSAALLIKTGADINATDSNEWTALNYAIRYNPDLIPLLLNSGADIEHRDKQGWTPLMNAAMTNAQTMQCLLENGADCLASCPNGETLLMFSNPDTEEVLTFWIDQALLKKELKGSLPKAEKSASIKKSHL